MWLLGCRGRTASAVSPYIDGPLGIEHRQRFSLVDVLGTRSISMHTRLPIAGGALHGFLQNEVRCHANGFGGSF